MRPFRPAPDDGASGNLIELRAMKRVGQRGPPGVTDIRLKTSAPRSELKVRNARIVVGTRRRRVRRIHGAVIESSRRMVPWIVSIVSVVPSRSMLPDVPCVPGIGIRGSRNRTKHNSDARAEAQNFTHRVALFIVP